ncbi:MAG: hypothetical protein JXB33_08610 [Clostridia bacterium]|nr:hypothetical protein [Clostridia bacterium]
MQGASLENESGPNEKQADADIQPDGESILETQPPTTTTSAEASLSGAKAGDIVYLGIYEQDGKEENGKEKIGWLVLKEEDGRLLLISEYGLECIPYNKLYGDVTWENCSLRYWLNNDFYNETFSPSEKELIVQVLLDNDDNPTYGTEGGIETKDNVFLLSIEEANIYFPDDVERRAKITPYVIGNGCYHIVDNEAWWWLRSPGNYPTCAAKVRPDGIIHEAGYYATETYTDAVRPAIWIKPKK